MEAIIEKIRKEIKRRIEVYLGNAQSCVGTDRIDGLDEILAFLDYLQTKEKEIPQNLEEAAKDAVEMMFGCDPAYFGNKTEMTASECEMLFIAGAEWMKEQMMKEAMEGEVSDFGENFIDIMDVYTKPLNLTKWGKVKLIIVKEQ